MAKVAPEWSPMRAPAGWARMAPCAGTDAVNGTEAGGRQGQEDGGMGGDRLVDPLATLEAGADQVAGVASVDTGASRTAALASGSARYEHHAIWQRGTREHDCALTVCSGRGVTTEADRMPAPTASIPLLHEVPERATSGVPPQRLDHRSVFGIHRRPPWRPVATMSQVRSGIQRDTASDNGTQRDTAGDRETQKKF